MKKETEISGVEHDMILKDEDENTHFKYLHSFARVID